MNHLLSVNTGNPTGQAVTSGIYNLLVDSAYEVQQNNTNHQLEEYNQSHLQNIRGHLEEGKKVMVLAHSQGTLYANAAYDLLT